MPIEDDALHAALDGAVRDSETASEGAPDSRRLAAYRAALTRLAAGRAQAPAQLVEQVMRALPETPDMAPWLRLRNWWPAGGAWRLPVLAGAAATLLLLAGAAYVGVWLPREQVRVTFAFHAPAARNVELVGSFNHWTPGQIQLQGPDRLGEWTVSVKLPRGRHEYMFVVDGRAWVPDPNAATRRPDGFGRENAVVDI